MELNTQKQLRFYESVVILNPQTSEQEQKEIFKKTKSVLESFGGELFQIETWGERILKNPINRILSAKYFYLLFKAEGGAIKELERNYKIKEDVLRFVHFNLDSRVPLEKHLENFHEEVKLGLQVYEEDQAFFNQRKTFRESRDKVSAPPKA